MPVGSLAPVWLSLDPPAALDPHLGLDHPVGLEPPAALDLPAALEPLEDLEPPAAPGSPSHHYPHLWTLDPGGGEGECARKRSDGVIRIWT